MDLSNLHAPVGSRKKRKRIGRGESSGQGKTAGKGHKGQNARSGTGGKVGFEGGQMPLMRRLPKFGFTNIHRLPVHIVTLDDLNGFKDGETVSIDTLKSNKLVPSKFSGRIKVLANGTLEKKLTIELERVSASAKAAIEKAGGNIVESQKQD